MEGKRNTSGNVNAQQPSIKNKDTRAMLIDVSLLNFAYIFVYFGQFCRITFTHFQHFNS